MPTLVVGMFSSAKSYMPRERGYGTGYTDVRNALNRNPATLLLDTITRRGLY